MPDLVLEAAPGWETALLVLVPAAEPAVGGHRARLDVAARDGVPAHITVLYPFLPPAGIGESLLVSLGRLFAGFPSCPPYGGQFAEVIPHLTIGHTGGPQALRAAAESVRPALPIESTAAEVVLMTGPRPGTPGTPPGQWRTIAAFPLG
jgi:hypothetical protein